MFGLTWPAIAALGCIIWGAILFLRSQRLAFGLSLVGFGVFAFGDIFKYRFLEQTTRPLLVEAETTAARLILASFLVFWLTYQLLAWNRPRPSVSGRAETAAPSRKFGWPQRFRSDRYFLVLLPLMVLSLTGLLAFPSWRQNSYLALLGVAVKAFCLFTFALYIERRRPVYLWIAVALLVPSMFETSRRIYIALFLPAIVVLLRSDLGRRVGQALRIGTRSRRWRRLAIAIVGLLALFVYLNFLRSRHDFGEGFVPDRQWANTLNYIRTMRSVDTFYNTGFLIESIPRRYDWFLGESYLSVFVGLVPRSLWPAKPVGLAATLGLMQTAGLDEFDATAWRKRGLISLSPGFVGEAYANFSSIGALVLSFLLGLGAFAFDVTDSRLRRRSMTHQLPWVTLAAAFLLLQRGDFYAAVFYPLTLGLAVALFRAVSMRSRN